MLDAALNMQLVAILLASIRIGMVLTFAPPFTYLGAPASFRVLLALGLGACFAAIRPATPLEGGALIAATGAEFFAGLVIVVVLQVAFGALDMAGRTLDIQAGQGFAGLIDPSSRAPAPLSGALYTRLAGLFFFAAGGAAQLLRLLNASFEAIPTFNLSANALARLGAYTTTAFGLAFTIAATSFVALFLTDVAIALLARTAPQINALILGIQIKSMVLLITLPLTFMGFGALFQRLNEAAFAALIQLMGR
jgi:flagellar biosynthetic protein FliR